MRTVTPAWRRLGLRAVPPYGSFFCALGDMIPAIDNSKRGYVTGTHASSDSLTMHIRTDRQDFPESCGRVELNSRIRALHSDDELGQLVQLQARIKDKTERSEVDWSRGRSRPCQLELVPHRLHRKNVHH